MAQTAADVLVEGVISRGVDTVFGIPGDGINGITEAPRRRQERLTLFGDKLSELF